MARRPALRTAGLVVLLAGLLLALWGFGVEPGRLRVREETLVLPGLPPSARGLRIALLADLHAGAPHQDRAAIRRIVERTNAARPDAILLLGDYVIQGVLGGRFVPPETTAVELGRLRAPLGVFAVLGNHDGWLDPARVRRALEANAIPVLANAARPLSARGVWVAGLEDFWTGLPSVAAALDSVPPGAPVLLMTHHPDVFPGVPARVALTVAGHTHGGQVRLPFLGRLVVPSAFGERYAAGHVVEGGRHLYVSTGTGTSILPVRFRVVPEISILTLR